MSYIKRCTLNLIKKKDLNILPITKIDPYNFHVARLHTNLINQSEDQFKIIDTDQLNLLRALKLLCQPTLTASHSNFTETDSICSGTYNQTIHTRLKNSIEFSHHVVGAVNFDIRITKQPSATHAEINQQMYAASRSAHKANIADSAITGSVKALRVLQCC